MPENRLEIIISLVLKEYPVGFKGSLPLKPMRCSFKRKNRLLYYAEYLWFISLFC